MPFSMILAHSFSFVKELGERLDTESVLIYQNSYLGNRPEVEKRLSSIKAVLVLFM